MSGVGAAGQRVEIVQDDLISCDIDLWGNRLIGVGIEYNAIVVTPLEPAEVPEVIPSQVSGSPSAPPLPSSPTKKKRKPSVQDDAEMRNRIESILAAEKNVRGIYDVRAMARVLAGDKTKNQGWGDETIRKILVGEYPPMKRLGINRVKQSKGG